MQGWLFDRKNLMALVMGPIDGILTALTLAADSVLRAHQSINISFACRIGIASSLSGAFVYFATQYLQLRNELQHAGRHLNLRKHGQLATSQLGKTVLQSSMGGALITGACSFLGASLPLLLVAIIPLPPWAALAAAISMLGILGWIMGWAVEGNRWLWSVSMIAAGILLGAAGVALHVT